MQTDEWKLLQRYVRDGDQGAFAELVGRYVDFVYGCCLRQVGDAHLAEDVVQSVFLLFAQRGKSLPARAVLSAWFFTAARLSCRNAIKVRYRRRRHETAAARPADSSAPAEVDAMDELKPLLDEAVSRLGHADQSAILLRYFQGRSVKEVAAALSISENAASQRLSRAIEKLRIAFARKGIALSTSVVVTGIAAAAVASASRAARAAAIDAGLSSAASANSSAALRARRTARTMRWKPVAPLLASAASVLAVVAACAAAIHLLQRNPAKSITPMSAISVAGPWAPALPSNPGGNTVLCEWEALVKPGLMQTINHLATPATTPSRGYQAMTCDAQALIVAMRNDAANLVPLNAANPTFISRNEENFPNGYPVNNFASADLEGGVMFFSNGTATATVQPQNNSLHLAVSSSSISAKLQAGDPDLDGSVAFTGDLPAGKALVFAGHVGPRNGVEVDDLLIWVAVPCPVDQEDFVRQMDRRIATDGLVKVLQISGAAQQWEAGAPSAMDAVSSRWVRTLPNGDVVRIVALSAPRIHPFQWWTADGIAVSAPASWQRVDSDVIAAIAVTDPSMPQRKPDGDDVFGRDRLTIVPVPHAAGQTVSLDIGAGGGPWRVSATLKLGQTVHDGQAAFTLKQIEPGLRKTGGSPGSITMTMDFRGIGDDEMTLTAVQKDGKQAYVPPPLPLADRAAIESSGSISDIIWVDISDLDHLVVKLRPRQWTHFAGMAAVPNAAPRPTRAAPAAPALLASTAPAPATNPSGPHTPEQDMADMDAAVAAGDFDTAAKHIYATTPLAKAIATEEIRGAIAGRKLLDAAVARFGKEQALSALKNQPLIPDTDFQREIHYKVEGDVAHAIMPANVHTVGNSDLRRDGGIWKMNVDLSDSAPQAMVRLMIKMSKASTQLADDLTAQTAAGKFSDAYALRDALRVGFEKLQAQFEAGSRAPSPATSEP